MAKKLKMVQILRGSIMCVSVGAMAASGLFVLWPQDAALDYKTTATTHDFALRGSHDATISKKLTASEPQQDLTQLKEVLAALDKGDVSAAMAVRDTMKDNDIDRKLIDWLLATSGSSDVPTSFIRQTKNALANWPGQSTMAKNIESAMLSNPLSIMRLRASLGDDKPQTFQTAFALAQSYLFTQNSNKARELLLPYWHKDVLSASDESAILATFGDVLTQRDHQIRYFNMMSRDRIKSGSRLVDMTGWEDLHSTWTSVIRRRSDAASALEALSDDDKKTAAYAFMLVDHLRKNGRDADAIKALDELPDNTAFLINPDPWWDERRILARNVAEDNQDFETAYRLVAAQTGGEPATQVDAAFHAGWFALRGLNDGSKAAPHFKKITEIAKGKISKARGYYWLGRALAGTLEGEEVMRAAADLTTTYYGQLALTELETASKDTIEPESAVSPPPEFAAPILAAERLSAAGNPNRARLFYTNMGWSWDNPKALQAAANSAAASGDYFAALKIAKAADWRGIDVGSYTHPLGAISDATGIDPIDHALAYSIARQESEFNTAAVSSANAQGLLQVLPGTAREMANRIDIPYESSKLTTDANYNAWLGVAYLNQQIDRFGGSYILTFAAYNAGPSRAKEWIDRFGDPRGKKLNEVIDWVEKIPFPETRSYVQRIMENLQVYKTKLGQPTSIENDLRFGTNTAQR